MGELSKAAGEFSAAVGGLIEEGHPLELPGRFSTATPEQMDRMREHGTTEVGGWLRSDGTFELDHVSLNRARDPSFGDSITVQDGPSTRKGRPGPKLTGDAAKPSRKNRE